MIGGLLLAAALVYGVARATAGYPQTMGRYRVLSRGEAAFVASTAEAMYPPGGAIAASGAEADLPRYVDRFLCASHPRVRLLLHLLFFLVEHATLLFPAPGWGGMRRFSSLSDDQRVAALDGWADSRWFVRRLVFTSLRALFTMGYFAHPPVCRSLRVAPLAIDSPVCEADLLYPRIGAHPDTLRDAGLEITPPSNGEPLALDAPLHPSFAEPRP